MFPMRSSFIFRSRWAALFWAAGIIWFAVSVAGSAPQVDNATANVDQANNAAEGF
jgi:hypothetical protein